MESCQRHRGSLNLLIKAIHPIKNTDNNVYANLLLQVDGLEQLCGEHVALLRWVF